ncbi:transposase [Bacillus andreraoultii]|uniref:transposase n=1 Tax=Bacillus andreraoultii TaxID=1499685 RepID=UPI00067E8782
MGKVQSSEKNGSKGISKTKEGLNAFYQLVRVSGMKEFLHSNRTFKTFENEILNSFIYINSNGFLEGINNHTKIIKRNAYGLKSSKRVRVRILLSHKYKGIGVHLS